ncbi:MAG: hypothetical protein Kapaf2KO_00730 [Candidatus Kapaibacteriales bacterium]
MRILYSFLIIMLLTSSAFSFSPKEKAKLYANGYAGKEFVVSFPPNYDPNYSKVLLGFHVLTIDETEVTLTYSASGESETFIIPEMSLQSFNTLNGKVSWSLEQFLDNGEPNDFTINIKADKPIYVNVINSKRYTSDGFSLLPVESWGYEYIHNSYYSYIFGGNSYFGSGFQVVSADDNNLVRVQVDTVAGSTLTLSDNRGINAKREFRLDDNEIVQLEGNGTSSYSADISGSRIYSADLMDKKPFSVVSYHKITWLPVDKGAGDPLYVASPPTSSYGTEFVTQSFFIDNEKGDYLRVVSAEDFNEVTIKTYHPETMEETATYFNILRATEVWSPFEAEMKAGIAEKFAAGLIKITTTKPSMVYKYICSSMWYQSPDAGVDPNYVNLTPTDLWTQGFAFAAPLDPDNSEVFLKSLHLTFRGSTNDKSLHDSLVNSIMINGERLTSYVGQSEIRNIPGTDYFSTSFSIIDDTYYYLTADTDVTGYVYGNSGWDSYGWNVGGNIRALDKDGNIPDTQHIAHSIIEKEDYTDIIVYSDAGNQISSLSWSELPSFVKIEAIDIDETEFDLQPNQSALAYRARISEAPTSPKTVDFAAMLRGESEAHEFAEEFAPIVDMEKVFTLNRSIIELGKLYGDIAKDFSVRVTTNPNNPTIIYDIKTPSDITLKESISFPVTAENQSWLEFVFFPTNADYEDGSNVSEQIIFETDTDTLKIDLTAFIGYPILEGIDITSKNILNSGTCDNSEDIRMSNVGSMDAKGVIIESIESDGTKVDFYQNGNDKKLEDLYLELETAFPSFLFENLTTENKDLNAYEDAVFGNVCFVGEESLELKINFWDMSEVKYSDKPFVVVTGDAIKSVEETDHIFEIAELGAGRFLVKGISGSFSISVIDIKGAAVTQASALGQHIIDLSEMANGVYVISLEIEGRRYTRKVTR